MIDKSLLKFIEDNNLGNVISMYGPLGLTPHTKRIYLVTNDVTYVVDYNFQKKEPDYTIVNIFDTDL